MNVCSRLSISSLFRCSSMHPRGASRALQLALYSADTRIPICMEIQNGRLSGLFLPPLVYRYLCACTSVCVYFQSRKTMLLIQLQIVQRCSVSAAFESHPEVSLMGRQNILAADNVLQNENLPNRYRFIS